MRGKIITHKAREVMQSIQQLSLDEKKYILDSILHLPEIESEIRDLTLLSAQFPNEWLAISVPEGEDHYAPQRGRLVAHHRERSATWDQVMRLPSSQDVYVFFTGAVTAKGFGVIFDDATNTPDVATVGN